MKIDQAAVFRLKPNAPVPKVKEILKRRGYRIEKNRTEQFKKLARRSGNTPLVDVSSYGITVPNGNRIIAKFEFQNFPTHSHYDRVYPYLFWCWEQTGIGPHTHEVMETSSGNASPAFANVAKELGYTPYCVVPKEISERRRSFSEKEGGIVIVSESEDGFGVPGAANRQKKELIKRIKERMKKPELKRLVSINHSQVSEALVPMRILVGEVVRAVKEKIDCFVGIAGNGTTLYGIGSELKRIFPEMKVWALEPRKQAGLYQMKYPTSPFKENGEELTEIIMPGSGVKGLNFPHLNASVEIVDNVRLVEAGEWAETEETFENASNISLGYTSSASLMAALEYSREVENQTIFTVFYDLLEKY